MRVVTITRRYIAHVAYLIQLYLNLGNVQFQRTAPATRFRERLKQLVQRVYLVADGFDVSAAFARGLVAIDLLVGQARRRAHHGAIKTHLAQTPVGIHAHIANHAQTIDLGIQGTQSIRQRLGQHR